MAATRRLAAILAADVAGYSRLIAADEADTLARLRAIRGGLVDPAIAAHGGRIVKTTGDGLLAEFASTVDALRCANEIQARMPVHNADAAATRRLAFRIGIHQGDIVVEDGDIFGDGVNIAARLEALAEPGGICVSARVQEDAAGKLDLGFEDLGEQQLKNIARPVRAYAVGGAGPRPRGGRRGVGAPSLAAGIIVLAVVIGGAWWVWPRASPPAATQPAASATPPSVPSEAKPAPRLSIVALPFANLGGEPEQQYLADGITEDLTTDLSRIPGMLVISRTSAFTYKNKPVNTKQIGQELGVRYVLEGSVQRSGNRLRITAQLIDAETDRHLWADRFDRDIGDMFALQSDITARIAATLKTELVNAEASRPSERPDVLEYILRGRAAWSKGTGREHRAEAATFFERALALDPHSVEAQGFLANLLVADMISAIADPSGDNLRRAEGLIEQALAAAPRNTQAHFAKAYLLAAQGRYADAVPEFETVAASDRSNAGAFSQIGWSKLAIGIIGDEPVALAEQAIRLNPRHPSVAAAYNLLAWVRLYQSPPDPDAAISWLDKAVLASPKFPWSYFSLAVAYGLKNDKDRAAAELAEAQKLSNWFSSIARYRAMVTKSNNALATPANHDRFERVALTGLRKAGMPEE